MQLQLQQSLQAKGPLAVLLLLLLLTALFRDPLPLVFPQLLPLCMSLCLPLQLSHLLLAHK